jgi:O-antigen ligase
VRQGQNSKITDKSSNSVWFLLIGVSAVTLFFKSDFYDPFNSAKLILLLVIDGWLLGHLINSYRLRPIITRSNEFHMTILLLGFIVSLLVSLMQTDVLLVGLIGETQRRGGFLSYIGLSVIFLYAVRSINFSNIIRVYKIGIVTGTLLSAYGVLQISGRDFVAWDNPYSSMISTLGNPNFASATLAILSLIGLSGVLVKNLHIFFKALGILLTTLALIAITISGSRQGLLVIFFSSIFYLSIYSYMRSRKLSLFVVGFSVAGAILAILGMLQKGPLVSLLYKDSVSVRGYYWRAGIEMFKDSPLTGVGVDRYGAFFKQFREVGYPLKYGYEITSSNAHNTFIQIFAMAGFFAGIFYLSLVIYVFVSGLRLLKQCQPNEKTIVLGLLSAWLGFQAQSLISIDNLGISVWGWLLGGSILGLSFAQKEEVKSLNEGSSKNMVKINLFQPLVSLVFLLPIIIFTSSLYKIEHNMFVLKGISSPSFPGNKPAVLKFANEVLNNPIADPFYKYRVTFHLYDMGFKKEAYQAASNIFDTDPINPDFLRGKVFFEESFGNVATIISTRKQIALIDPWNAENYFQLLKLYKLSGDIENANAMKDKILSFAAETDFGKSALEILG